MHQSGIPALIILQFSSDEIVPTARLNLVRSILSSIRKYFNF